MRYNDEMNRNERGSGLEIIIGNQLCEKIQMPVEARPTAIICMRKEAADEIRDAVNELLPHEQDVVQIGPRKNAPVNACWQTVVTPLKKNSRSFYTAGKPHKKIFDGALKLPHNTVDDFLWLYGA